MNKKKKKLFLNKSLLSCTKVKGQIKSIDSSLSNYYHEGNSFALKDTRGMFKEFLISNNLCGINQRKQRFKFSQFMIYGVRVVKNKESIFFIEKEYAQNNLPKNFFAIVML